MSTLWTPSGEHQPEDPVDHTGGDDTPYGEPYEGDPSPEAIEEMLRTRAELTSVPVVDILANHAVGIWQLALLHPDVAAVATARGLARAAEFRWDQCAERVWRAYLAALEIKA